jgi:3-hydroxyacyl-[acyl-carrier-protein] dehydratase
MIRNMKNIKKLLLHREPFLLVDSVIIEDRKILGNKIFTKDMDFFKGHFPGNPIVPGVIIIESMVQCGGAGLKLLREQPASLFTLMKIENATFHQIVKPEEKIVYIIENMIDNGKMINQIGKAFVNNKLVAKAEWICIEISI